MTKPFADFKEDLRLFCSENKIDNDKISIVGVSKKKSLEDILSLYRLGLRDFGENYAQELNGLMFMPNINQDKVSHIKEIKDSVNLFNDMKAKRRNIQVLSLGTSSDYKECIKAGSNLIRVGEILFGPRL